MAYGTKIWGQVKGDYESGELSIVKMAQKWGISATAIENKIIAEKWIKGEKKDQIIQTIAEKNIERFAKLGMTPEKLATRIITGVNSDEDNVAIKYIQEHNKMCGSLAPQKSEHSGKDGSPLIPQNYSIDDLKKELKDLLNDMSG